MVLNTQDEKIVSEEQEKRFHELNCNPDDQRTDDERKELQQLKDNYSKTARDRIGELSRKEKLALARAEEAERKLEEERAKREELERNKIPPKVDLREEIVKIGDKQFYSDATLSSKINSGEITESEAFRHQQERLEEAAAEKAYRRLKSEQEKDSELAIRRQDADELFRDYPHFNPKHPNHNPDDQLYKKANELYAKGYHSNPRGLTEAVKDAKIMLRMSDMRIDRSADLSAEEPNVSERNIRPKDEQVTLNEYEKETAIRIYTLGNVINPKTRRAYTEQEAIAKALEGKKQQMAARRRTRR